MPKVWDNCFSCGTELIESEKEHDWRECKRCKKLNLSIKLLALLGLGFVWFLFIYNSKWGNYHSCFSVIGLSCDILGAWLLATGYVEIMVRAVGGWGGGTDTLDKFSPKHFWKRTIGLIFLVLGFLLQSLSYVI